VYKDPSLHFFDVRRLYSCLIEERLLEAVLGADTIRTVAEMAGAEDKSRVEALQMALLDVLSREAEATLKSSGASFLGSVLLKEKKASIKDFKMLKVIGKGSFGKVLLAKHSRSESIYAVKVMDKEAILAQDVAGRIMSEHNVLLGNEMHPFLVGLHYSFQTASKLYFVLDYVNGGELYFHLNKDKKFTEKRALFYAAELTSALGFLHDHHVLYRDLKPENILLDKDGHIMLTDFGLCKEGMGPEDTTGTFCGTPEYLAPEMLQKTPYGRAVDWWTLGCVTYEMIVGLPPFYCQDWQKMYELILHGELKFPGGVSARCRGLLEGLLNRDPVNRLGSGAADAAAVKKHPAFASFDFAALENREVPPLPPARRPRVRLHACERVQETVCCEAAGSHHLTAPCLLGCEQITPPFNPAVLDYLDLRNFDPEVTSEEIPDNVDKASLGLPPPLDATGADVVSAGPFPGASTAAGAPASFDGFSGVGQLSPDL